MRQTQNKAVKQKTCNLGIGALAFRNKNKAKFQNSSALSWQLDNGQIVGPRTEDPCMSWSFEACLDNVQMFLNVCMYVCM